MASSYTGLGTELMTTGENAGTWGTTTNTNLQIIEQMVGGYTEQSIAGGVQTTTLSVSDGSTGAVLSHRVIKFTGTITGNQTVTIPLDVQQMYILVNGTSGAYTVNFKYVSGSGSSITFATTDKGTKFVYAAADHASNPNLVDTGISTNNLTGVTGDITVDSPADIILDADGANVTIKDGGTTILDFVANGATDVTLDAPGDIKLDADGGDVFFIDGGTTFGSATNTSGNLIIKSGTTTAATFSGANVTLAGTVASGAITSSGIIKTDATTAATSTTDGSLQTDGGLSVAADAVIGDDLKLLSDSAVLSFGADSDTTLTHTDCTGLTLNITNKLTFGDVATYINQSSDGVMTVAGEATIDLTASTAVLVSNDLKLDSDSAVLGFGADNDTTLTPVSYTHLTLQTTPYV